MPVVEQLLLGTVLVAEQEFDPLLELVPLLEPLQLN